MNIYNKIETKGLCILKLNLFCDLNESQICAGCPAVIRKEEDTFFTSLSRLREGEFFTVETDFEELKKGFIYQFLGSELDFFHVKNDTFTEFIKVSKNILVIKQL